MNINDILKKEFNLRDEQINNTIKLIDEGNTIPFIARYRKEMTGEMSDVTLRAFYDKLIYLRNLQNRKDDVIRIIEEQGKLTSEIKVSIEKANTLQEVEDIYAPYKQKKRTRATIAKERGLEQLALDILNKNISNINEEVSKYINPEKDVNSVEDAIKGANDIIAEIVSDDAKIRKYIRELALREGVIVTKNSNEEKSVYDMYYDYSESVKTIAPHRVLAINRGEKEDFLKVKVEINNEKVINYIINEYVNDKNLKNKEVIVSAIEDSYKRLIFPSIEREIRNTLTENAQERAISVFGKNVKSLLLQAPVKDKVVMGFDPAFRTGCKIAVVDKNGKLLDTTTVYPTEPQNKVEESKKELKALIEKYNIDIIAIGNGTASRESEQFVADTIKEYKEQSGEEIYYAIVSEAGASVYSASELATKEYPDLDVTTRGAMSLGRRLQDPLAELVKIDPKSIGVGQYQHDINQKMLEGALTNVVENCVNRVGVDLNTASPSLLSYIAGINMGIAKNIVAYREENGKFTDRKQLMKVSKLGEKAFNQCAGFLRIADGKNPLDATSVHPESYGAATAMMEKLGVNPEDIRTGGDKTIEDKIKAEYKAKNLAKAISQMAAELGVGEMTLADIVEEMKKPARDPREDAPPVVFRNDVKSFDDLKIDMEMTGTVRNVVDFGAFVDIGVKNDGLVHISQLSDKYIKHPMDVVSVGDTVKVKIISIDREKMKVGLTMKL